MALSLSRGLSVAGTIIGVVVVVSIIAALSPTFWSSLESGVENTTNAQTGNDTADALMPILGLIFALAGAFGLVTLAIAAFDRFQK